MKTYILIYDEFAQFEVVLASYFLKTKGEVIMVGLTEDAVVSSEGFRIVPDMCIADIQVQDIDVFIVPGGNPANVYPYPRIYDILAELNKSQKVIGAICAGVIHLGKAGILAGNDYTTSMDIQDYDCLMEDGYIDENTVISKHIITAKATGYVDFAIDMGKMMEIYEDEKDLEETIRFYKYFGQEK